MCSTFIGTTCNTSTSHTLCTTIILFIELHLLIMKFCIFLISISRSEFSLSVRKETVDFHTFLACALCWSVYFCVFLFKYRCRSISSLSFAVLLLFSIILLMLKLKTQIEHSGRVIIKRKRLHIEIDSTFSDILSKATAKEKKIKEELHRNKLTHDQKKPFQTFILRYYDTIWNSISSRQI